MRASAPLLLLLTLWAKTAWPQESAALADDPEDWRHRVDAIAAFNDAIDDGDPLTAPFIACSGTACSHQSLITLSAAEAEQLRRLFVVADTQDSALNQDADQERRAIAGVIARVEDFVGTVNGTWADAPGNRHADGDDPTQLDCVSETSNTRTILHRLSLAGLLSHHRLGEVVTRYTVLLQHVAVTVIDDSDTEFVVDSWVGANGDEPEIEPYYDWRMQWGV